MLVPELLLSLELVALASFAFTRPVLDSFGRSPETFMARGTFGWWIVAFCAVVALVPSAVAALTGVAARRLGRRAHRWAQPLLVGVLGGVGVWRVGQDVTGRPAGSVVLLLAGSAAGVLLLAARARFDAARSFLRIAGVSSVVYPLLFLFASPVSSLVTERTAITDAEIVEGIDAQLGDDPPNVLFLVFDELPTMSLLDGTGRIDAELFPRFAELAGDGTWYRNHTTVAGVTLDAVPALLTGRYPQPDRVGLVVDQDPQNIFSLLGASYDVTAHENVTKLCPDQLCPLEHSGELGPLLEEAVDHWLGGAAQSGEAALPVMPGLADSYQRALEAVERLDLAPGGRPDLVVDHIMLPHGPWRLTGDGARYDGSYPPPGVAFDGWGEAGVEVAHQRHLLQLQATDDLLGRYLDVLHDGGVYDDTLVVVTADHGVAFTPDASLRGLAADNYEQIMWTPLLVKAPGQTEAVVDDRDVRSVDVVPTIADMLGVEIPWSVDGASIAGGDERDSATKPFDADVSNELHPEEGEDLIEVDARAGFARVLAADPVEWSGPDAIWKRTVHGDLFGRPVDDLTVGAPADGEIRVDGLDRYRDVALDEPLPLEVVGRTELGEGTYVAYAVNGTIGAVTAVEPSAGGGPRLVQGIVPPRLVVEGANELRAYVVDGPVGEEVLHPLAVSGG